MCIRKFDLLGNKKYILNIPTGNGTEANSIRTYFSKALRLLD